MPIDKVIEPDNPRRYVRRIGDWAQEGGNNTIIIMGTDRPSSVDSGLGDKPGTGCIHMIAGRHTQNGDPDPDKDDSYIYLARKTDADTNLGTGMEVADDNIAAAIIKSDVLRFVARKSVKVVRDDSHYIYMDDQYSMLKIGDTTIKVDGAGVHVNSPGMKVEVTTKDATVTADSTTINSKTTINGETTINGATKIIPTLEVAAKVTTPILAVGVLAAGPGGGGASVLQGALQTTGDVTAAGKSLDTHTHPVPGVKAGGDTASSGPPR